MDYLDQHDIEQLVLLIKKRTEKSDSSIMEMLSSTALQEMWDILKKLNIEISKEAQERQWLQKALRDLL